MPASSDRLVPLKLRIPAVILSVLAMVACVTHMGAIPVMWGIWLFRDYADEPKIEIFMPLFSTVFYGLIFIPNATVVWGSWQARKLRSYHWALTASILSCIPLLSPLVYLGIPFGVWMLIVLLRKDVRELFDAERTTTTASLE